MHYRISIYNYFFINFKKENIDFIVRTNKVQKSNKNEILFDCKEIDFSIFNYIKEINLIKPDAVILFLHLKEKIYWFLVHWLKYNNIPIIYWNKAINYDAPESWLRNRMFNYMHTISDSIILYSESEKYNIRKKNQHKLFFANNTINFEDFPDITETKEEIKKQFCVAFKYVVLFTGRIKTSGGRKKVDHLIHVFNQLERDDIGLVIVGSGFSESLKKMIKKNNVLYLGEIHDPQNINISKVFKMADIFSVPGHIGLGINQAMFWKLPVVTEEGGQPPEINYLIDGETGYLVKNNDIEELKNKILTLIENTKTRLEFGKKAHRHIMKVASINNMYKVFCTSIKSVL
jgi:glycosyltransferase involved in cell wall biosynthesis